MSNTIKTAELVKSILTKNAIARDNDMMLYEYIMNYYGVSVKSSFDEVKRMIDNKKLPTLWSVERARRKVQELYEELRPSDYAKKAKNDLEEEYVALSKCKTITEV